VAEIAKEPPALMSLREGAEILGVSRESMRRLIKAGSLEPVRIPGLGNARYRRADIERLVAGEVRAP
jgi:excisionase family DNA binding protein